MPNTLRLRFEPDTDGTGELFAEVQQGAFAGSGSAWFGTEELAAFGNALQNTFPLERERELTLSGGFWSKSGAARLEECHLELRVYPIGGTGTVGIRVRLATPIHSGTREASQCTVAVELQTNYEHLRSFGSAIVALGSENEEAAVLAGSDG